MGCWCADVRRLAFCMGSVSGEESLWGTFRVGFGWSGGIGGPAGGGVVEAEVDEAA